MLVKKFAVFAGLVVLAGCHCGSTYQESSYGCAPDATGALPPAEKSFVDRHPLLSAPRNYYRDSSDNPVVKVLAGTVVGVPVGVAQELWQIGYGQ